jgi:hypothetical protein
MFKKVIFSILFFFSVFLNAQKTDSAIYVFKEAEIELKQLIKQTFYSKNEKERIEGNKKFIAVWDKIISNPKILDYGFDELKNDVSILSPKDKKFKLITWDFHKEDGTYAYFGFLLVNNSKRIKKGLFKHETIEEYEYFKLIDNSAIIKNPETHVGTPAKWFGMLYYSIVECEGFYTLLARDMNDKITQRKFVDVLYFKSDGTPVFGKDVFRFPKKNPRRIMFEYSSDISMSLRYNEKTNQIVYSHLAPKQGGAELEGQFQFYGPDGSFDALELKKDKWITIEDIDARNDKNKNDKKKHGKEQTPIIPSK